MFAIFAADGIARTAGWLSARFGVIRRDVAEYAIGATLAVAFIVFTFPVLSRVRNDITPSVQAVRTVVQDFDPAQQTLYVAYSMVPFMEYFAPSYPMIRVPNELAVPLGDKANAFLLADVTGEDREATFRRARGALWNIARRHYFDVALTPITTRATFGRGWYPAEVEGEQESRVMIEETATITLPAAGQATALSFTMDVPGELAGATLTVSLNGRVLDRFALTGEIARRFEVPPGQHQLELSIDRTAEIDGRIRGARLRSLSWGTS